MGTYGRSDRTLHERSVRTVRAHTINELRDSHGRSAPEVAIAASEWNNTIVEPLIDGALENLAKHNIKDDTTTLVYVPGAFELPIIAQKLAQTGKYDGIICLGCVIRGATPHFDYVAGQAASGILQVGLANKLPVVFGVLTTDSLEQARERAGGAVGNKGSEAAQALIDLLSVFAQIDAS